MQIEEKREYRFWFEYIEYDTSQAWGGGHWQLYKSPDKQMLIRVGLSPVYPLDFRAFKTRRPVPEEIEVIIQHHITLDISPDDAAELDQLLRQSFQYQFRSELIPGRRLEIYNDDPLSVEMEKVLNHIGIERELTK